MSTTTSTQLNRIRQRLDDMNLAVGTFARACGFSPSALSQAMRGGMGLTGPSEAKLAEASALLYDVSLAIYPLALPGNAHDLQMILEQVKENELIALREIRNKVFNVSGSKS